MAFRRQDIPKTTRKGKDGQPRRIYPRYIRDSSLLSKIDIAIGYLDGMVGRRRGELSSDAVLDLVGDPKMARCIVSCLADTYRYRTLEFAEVVGEETAARLAGWELLEPADVRDFVYRALNERRDGVVGLSEREYFLRDLGETLGVEADVLDQLLHLDAERNAVLIRTGERPRAADVVARYNALLTLSVLRQASVVEIELAGLSRTMVETLCARWDVSSRRLGDERWTLAGRRDAMGSWARFGIKLARCVAHLIVLAPRSPVGFAKVHLGDQSLHFVLDDKSTASLRPKQRQASGVDGLIRTAVLAEEMSSSRRTGDETLRGWTVRRATEPVVVEGAIVMPELLFVSGRTSIGLATVESTCSEATINALRKANLLRPVVACGDVAGLTDLPVLRMMSVGEVGAMLDQFEIKTVATTPVDRLRDELVATGWVMDGRVVDVLGDLDLAKRLRPLVEDGEATMVPGFGLCRTTVLDDWFDRFLDGEVDVTRVRTDLAAVLGDTGAADAVTLHLLSRQPVTATGRVAA